MTTRIIVTLSVVSCILGILLGIYHLGRVDGRDECLSDATRQANEAWVQRFTLESQLATRDAQLAEAQQAASAVRTETVTKREVIYRDRIKTRTVRDCVDNSGVWQLYNSTLGVADGQQ